MTSEAKNVLIDTYLEITVEWFKKTVKIVLSRMFKAYFYYAKCMTEPGLSSTMRKYLS